MIAYVLSFNDKRESLASIFISGATAITILPGFKSIVPGGINFPAPTITIGNIGMVYQQQGDLAAAQQYFFKSLGLAEEINDKRGMSIVLPEVAANCAAAVSIGRPTNPQYGFTAIRRSSGHAGAIRAHAVSTSMLSDGGATFCRPWGELVMSVMPRVPGAPALQTGHATGPPATLAAATVGTCSSSR